MKGTSLLFRPTVVQGYNCDISHSGDYAIDFVMDEGTNVLAARDGTVTSVVDSNTGSCPISQDCRGNFVKITHTDGSYALYLHLKQGGACVTSGQVVQKGDVIGLSGNVGLSTGPHLHFEVDLTNSTTPTFADVAGDGIPVFGKYYTSDNSINVNHCESATLQGRRMTTSHHDLLRGLN
ncbi:DD-endopeptidase MepM [Seminavis robusta]|uniref:DD-endopeptidase MepM n=1 Tax=Seminavis robusta TaxID=568900 RepID=A0A9N8ECA1_9STRA|nr:DD-endopeptidase MepM [Seminavis robusta]|eukprot:Sro737_g195070.1 DD-endopeptidase MepM (179) ;mRNA; f:2183-2719